MTALWHPFADMGAVQDAEFVIERGEDVWVWDSEGRRYLDGTASLWYANVGHGRREIAAAIAELPPRQRAAIALCYDQDLTCAEAAKAMGVTIGTMESLLFRARRTLRERLGPLNGDV